MSFEAGSSRASVSPEDFMLEHKASDFRKTYKDNIKNYYEGSIEAYAAEGGLGAAMDAIRFLLGKYYARLRSEQNEQIKKKLNKLIDDFGRLYKDLEDRKI